MNTYCHELIQRYIVGTITNEEALRLQDSLKRDDQLAELYLSYVNLDVALEVKAEAKEMSPAQDQFIDPPPRRWTGWVYRLRPLTAAGVVFGLFSASVVYGLVSQRHLSVQTLLTEGFENSSMDRDRGVPLREGVWSGDLESPEGAVGEVQPTEGRRMVKLPPVEKRQFSYAFRFLDVAKFPTISASETRQIEVMAQFHGAAPDALNRFQIRLAAFAEDAIGARDIWVSGNLDEQALLHVAKTVKVQNITHGWTTVRSMIDVPVGAKVVLVSLAAGGVENEEPKTAYYLDDVQVRLISHESPLP